MSRVSTVRDNGQLTTASRLLQRLRDHGVDYVFGVVGREAAAIMFDEADGLQFILTRHEFTAGVMADVLAKLTNRPQACFATLGPGVTNLSTGVVTSALDRSPVIALGAQCETHDAIPLHTHQCIDTVALMATVTKRSAEVTRVDEVEAIVDELLDECLTEPVGPTFLSIPINILGAKAESPRRTLRPLARRTTRAADVTEQAAAAAKLVSQAARPVFVVGSAAIRAECADLIKSIAERLQIPVITTYTAKGVLPTEHALNYGAVSGYMDGILQFEALESLFGPADLIVTIGYDYAEDLRPSMWTRGTEKKTVRIAPFSNPVPTLFSPDVDLVDEVDTALRAIDELLTSCEAKVPHDISELRNRIGERLKDDNIYEDGMRVHQVLACVNDSSAETIVSDIGFFRHYGVIFAKANREYGFITSAGASSFGYGLPAAMAASLARPGEPIVLLAGDGGFHSNSQDLETAVRLGLPVIVLVLNNSRNGLIELYQQMGHNRRFGPAVEFGEVDFAALAAANGCASFNAHDRASLTEALEKAFTVQGPAVIEVPIAYDFSTGAGFGALEI